MPEPDAPEPLWGPTDDGTVVLDVGGDVGALVVTTDEGWVGTEIELSPVGAEGRRRHVAVRERRGAGRSRFAAVFPALAAGDYVVWDKADRPVGRVTVVGGQVAHLSWP